MKNLAGQYLFRKGIKHRLAVAFSVFLVLLMVMVGVGVWRLAELDAAAAHLAGTASVDWRIERLTGAWLAEARTDALRAVVVANSDEPELSRIVMPQMAAASTRISALHQELDALVKDSQARALLNEAAARRDAYLEARRAVLEKRQAGQPAAARALLNASLAPAADAYIGSISRLAERGGNAARAEAAKTATTAESGRAILIGIGAAGLVFGILFAWWITASVSRPLRRASAVASRVAEGDLTETLDARELAETGHLLQAIAHMTDNLRSLLRQVSAGARTVSDTSAQIAQGNLDLSQRTEEQASTLEETASSMEQLTSTVAHNAENAQKASQLAMGASEVAQRGSQVVDQVLGTMDEISDASKKISDIIGVIDGIAFQTNILALNAAVEAARAGEEGRGFAVVATEVRNLAQKTGAAAKEIKTLIANSVQKVQAGASLADAAGHTMVEVVSSVGKVTSLIAEIAAASREQSSGIAQINAALGQMEHVVQQNASLVEEATAATESMKDQADRLLQAVSSFRLGDEQPELAPLHQAAPRSAALWTDAPAHGRGLAPVYSPAMRVATPRPSLGN